MNELVVASHPNAHVSSIMACAPDDTLVYGTRHEVAIIKPPVETGRAADVQIIYNAHNERVTGVCINDSWNKPDKLIVSCGEDNMVKMWDASTCKQKIAHDSHVGTSGKCIGVSYVNNTVTSATDTGHFVIWCVRTNTVRELSEFLKTKLNVLAACPHQKELVAVGAKNGLIFIVNTKGKGEVLYKLRGHDLEAVSLSWCPSPYNIFKINSSDTSPKSKLAIKSDVTNIGNKDIDDDICKIIDDTDRISLENDGPKNSEKSKIETNSVINETTADTVLRPSIKIKKANLWSNLEFPQDLENSAVIEDELNFENETTVDFLSECAELKNEILEGKTDAMVSDSEESANKRFSFNNESAKPTEVRSTFIDQRISSKLLNLIDECNKSGSEDTEPWACEKVSGDNLRENSFKKSNPEIHVDMKTEHAVEDNLIDLQKNYSFVSDASTDVCETFDKIEKNDSDVGKTETDTYDKDRNISTPLTEGDSDTTSETQAGITLPFFLKPMEIYKNLDVSLSSSLVVEVSESDFDMSKADFLDIEDGERSILLAKRSKPKRSENTSQLPLKEFLLASGSKQGPLYIWRIGDDGRMQTELRLKEKFNKKNYYRGLQGGWSTVCWARPGQLLFTSHNAELFLWNLFEEKERLSKSYHLVHNDHNGSVFSIAVPPATDLTEAQMLLQERCQAPHAWTQGSDRWLFCTSLFASRRMIASYPSFGGFIYRIAAWPLDPNRLAIAVGDQSLRTWDLSRPHTTNIQMNIVRQKIKGKVMTVSWHPTKETCVAFGTWEGRVGLYDPGTVSKSPVILYQYLKSAVYSLSWGPAPHLPPNQLALYAYGEGKCVIYDLENKNSEPKLLHFAQVDDKIKLTDVAWNYDYTYLAVGYKDGSVVIANPDFEVVVTVYEHKKAVQCLAWHPLCTAEDEHESPYANWLAVSSNENNILVYDCAELKKDAKMLRSHVRLCNHTDSICQMAWSPHENAKLVSVSFDGTAQVWDVLKSTVIGTFIGHCGDGVYCALWSPLNSNMIITGGKDCCLRVWDYTKYPPSEEKPPRRKNKVKSLKSLAAMVESDGISVVKKEEIVITDETIPLAVKLPVDGEKKKSLGRNFLLPKISYLQNQSSADERIDSIRDVLRLYDDTNGIDPESTISSDESGSFIINSKSGNMANHVRLFGTRNDILNLIDIEQKSHADFQRWDMYQHLMLWREDIPNMIQEATEHRRLTAWHVSIAPTASHKLWRSTCAAYAEQLLDTNEVLEAVSYLLLIHETEKAIEVLCRENYFREAAVIAQCRLSAEDVTIEKVFQSWAEKEVLNGNFEIAAECYIRLGQFSDAAKYLAKRSNIEAKKLALELAIRGENTNLATLLRAEINEESFTDKTTTTPQKIGDTLVTSDDVLDKTSVTVEKKVDTADKISDTLEKYSALKEIGHTAVTSDSALENNSPPKDHTMVTSDDSLEKNDLAVEKIGDTLENNSAPKKIDHTVVASGDYLEKNDVTVEKIGDTSENNSAPKKIDHTVVASGDYLEKNGVAVEKIGDTLENNSAPKKIDHTVVASDNSLEKIDVAVEKIGDTSENNSAPKKIDHTVVASDDSLEKIDVTVEKIGDTLKKTVVISSDALEKNSDALEKTIDDNLEKSSKSSETSALEME